MGSDINKGYIIAFGPFLMLCDDGYRKDLSRVYQPRFWLRMRATLQFLFSVLDRLYNVAVICTTFYRHERVSVTWLRSI